MTFIHHYNVWCNDMKMYGYTNFKKQLPYSSFIRSWYSFMDLLDVNYEIGMTCEECGPSPKLVICDGTSLGFQKKFLPVVLEVCPPEKSTIPRVR